MRRKKKTSNKSSKIKPFTYPEFIQGRFKGEEVHVVASGPSLVGFDYNRLKSKRVIAVNHAYKLVDHEFCVFVDKGFARRESPDVIKKTICVTRQDIDFPEHIVFKFADGREGRSNTFTLDPNNGVWYRGSSGSIGLCAALQGGASKVYLYGFDCRFFTRQEATEAAILNGKKEVSQNLVSQTKLIIAHSTTGIKGFEHEREKANDEQAFKDSIQYFAKFPRKQIVNMSKFSAIPYFEKSSKPYVD